MKHRELMAGLIILLLAGCTSRSAKKEAHADTAAADARGNRTFLFTYSTTITGLEAGQTARVWLPVASSDADQQVHVVNMKVPTHAKVTTEPKFGNRILYAEVNAKDGSEIPLSITYFVNRTEVKGDSRTEADSDDAEKYLLPDAKVPVGGKPLMLLQGKSLPADQTQRARLLYDLVDSHMAYRKDKPGWGNGDAEWACESGSGNCSDFHSLFISLARSQRIPAKFEMGFPLPEKRGTGTIAGYHCWAKFKPQASGWISVDISEADKHPLMKDYYFGNLTPDRVRFTVGRDLDLVPKQNGPALNFFIYPYVEVNGAVLASDKMQTKFSFQDVDSSFEPIN
jgi:transglutaminase-like putative cysteine protease